ncbi:hypothetical protein TNCV_4214481 [Trichonephila clavipes]|nr:hypothetical protein TNCV_4214481 [Trichonephila clavipes]
MQYRTRVRNSACSFCSIVGVTDLHAMLIRLSKSYLLVDSRWYTLFLGNPRERNPEDLGRVIVGATPVDLRSRLFKCQMSAPKIYMVEQICVREHHHTVTTFVINPVRKLNLLKKISYRYR